MKSRLTLWFAATLSCLLFACLATPATAEDSATGKWKWSSERDGKITEYTLVLKQDGEKLTGTLARATAESSIEDGKIKNGELSFKVTRELDGKQFTISYQGKLSSDLIKGTSSSDREGHKNTRDWEAKRLKE